MYLPKIDRMFYFRAIHIIPPLTDISCVVFRVLVLSFVQQSLLCNGNIFSVGLIGCRCTRACHYCSFPFLCVPFIAFNLLR